MVLLRALLFLIRIVFGIILIFLIGKLIGSWLFSGKAQKVSTNKPKEDQEYYKYLTDQEIEDADFEEIDSKEERD